MNNELRLSLKSIAILAIVLNPLFASDSFKVERKNLEQAFNLSSLPVSDIDAALDYTKGAAKFRFSANNAPWGGYYFPMNQGGISQRWQIRGISESGRARYFYPYNYIKVKVPQSDEEREAGDVARYKYEKISVEQAKERIENLSQEDIDNLSPIEKFDLFKGDYNFKGTMHEKLKNGEYRDGFLPMKYWNGFCNGARAAGALAPEPVKPVTVVNAEGLKITFEPADMKALISASYFYPEYTSYLGQKTDFGRRLNKHAPNAAALDIALRTYMAKHKKAFFMDKDPTHHLSNVTIIGYDREIVKERKIKKKEYKAYKLPKNAVKAVKIVNKIEYLAEVKVKETNGETRHAVASGEHSHFITAKYTLFVDKNNKIIDGRITRRYSGVPFLLGKGVDMIWFAAGEGDYHEWIDFSKEPDANGLYPHAGNKHLDYKSVMQLINQSKIQ